MLNTVVNTTQENNTQLSGPCLQYVDFKKRSIFESNMPIAHTISADRAMKKGFAESISKRYPELRHFCNSIHANINDILIFTDPKFGQIIYNLITNQRYFQKPIYDAIFNTLSEMKDHAIANNIRSTILFPSGRSLQVLMTRINGSYFTSSDLSRLPSSTSNR